MDKSKIFICETDDDIYTKNNKGRILFRFNKHHETFSFFRSKYMTEDEKKFCISALDTLQKKNKCFTEDELMDFFNFNNKKDVFCV